jgi:hypothetical protein
MVIVPVVASVVTAAALVGSRSEGAFWAGGTFLLTCGYVGLAILGAVWGRGRRRAVWLGVALFGAGYLVLAFGRYPDPDAFPYLTADRFVSTLYDWLPRVSRSASIPPKGIAASNARIRGLLEERVPMHFPNETPVEDVLKYINEATKHGEDPGIPIYMDPVGFQEAERTMTSPVALDLEGVPLKTTLRLMLEQLGLEYVVRDGVLIISSKDGDGWLPVYDDDPALLIVHCLFAVLASVFGGVASGYLYNRRGGPSREVARGLS